MYVRTIFILRFYHTTETRRWAFTLARNFAGVLFLLVQSSQDDHLFKHRHNMKPIRLYAYTSEKTTFARQLKYIVKRVTAYSFPLRKIMIN